MKSVSVMQFFLACLISLFTEFRILLKIAQSFGSLERVACIFKIFLSCIRFFNSCVIHGDFLALTRFVFKGACLSTTLLNMFFQACHMSLGVVIGLNDIPVLQIDVISKSGRIKIFKFSIGY